MGVKNLIQNFVVNYVNVLAYPEKVYLSVVETPGVILVDLESGDKEDLAKLIGKNGILANSLRYILYRMSEPFEKRIMVNFNRLQNNSGDSYSVYKVFDLLEGIPKFDKDYKGAITSFVDSYVNLAKESFKVKYSFTKDFQCSVNVFETDKRIIVELNGDSRFMGYVVGRRKVFLKRLLNIFRAISGRLHRELKLDKTVSVFV